MIDISGTIAQELSLDKKQITAAMSLLDEGATVPFIARYRKEATQGLTDTHLRHLQERLIYLRELIDRQQTILESISKQGKLTPALEKEILSTDNKAHLEDLYLPYKPKRQTKAEIAKTAGLEPLAKALLHNPTEQPESLALSYLNPDHQIQTSDDALQGARYIVMENLAETATLLATLREFLLHHAKLQSEVLPDQETAAIKFKDYFAFDEPLTKIPSHRALALFRGRRENFLRLQLLIEPIDLEKILQKIVQTLSWQDQKRAADPWIQKTIEWAWKIKLLPKLELDLLTELREKSEKEAIQVFANNLKHLLMAAPAGLKTTLGLDPGLRTGVKVVVVDPTGKLLDYCTIFPHAPKNQWRESIELLAKLIKKYAVNLISIGNGTASRETEKLVNELLKQYIDLRCDTLIVSEAGASVYSASELAAKEFPDLDVSYRGAVSIARRLQDPLAELVKIEPKAIGVGQYQHDVNQIQLARMLDAVVEDCVNAVGVDLNTASAALLTHVSGLNQTLAQNIVIFRETYGAFTNRSALKNVPRFGEKAFEQAAGFLRIMQGDVPLDASTIHPESYSVVEKILAKNHFNLNQLIGKPETLRTLKAVDYVDAQFGLPTVQDILAELEKPGRDPRPAFVAVKFKEGVEKLEDLKPGMSLEGMVTNVANFGAFVDIGVHQDGLVHVSQLANYFVKDPNDVVKVGDIVQVKVLEVDLARKRISLSLKTG